LLATGSNNVAAFEAKPKTWPAAAFTGPLFRRWLKRGYASQARSRRSERKSHDFRYVKQVSGDSIGFATSFAGFVLPLAGILAEG